MRKFLKVGPATSSLAALGLAGLGVVFTPAAVAQTTTFIYTNMDNFIFKKQSFIESPIDVTLLTDTGGLGVITDVDVAVDFTHTWWSRLDASVSNGLTTEVLFSEDGGTSQPNGEYILDNSEASPIGSSITPGRYSPQGSLAAFNGPPQDGTWTLRIDEDADAPQCVPTCTPKFLPSGQLNAWSLIFTVKAADQAFVGDVLQDIVSGDVRQLVGTLEERMNAAFGGGMGPAADAGNPFDAPPGEASGGLWLRASAARADGEGAVTNLFLPGTASYEEDSHFIQGGGSFVVMDSGASRMVGSVFGHYLASDSDVSNGVGPVGTVGTTGYGGGASLTWLWANGIYTDSAGLIVAHDLDVGTAGGDTGNTDALTLASSSEMGLRLDLGQGFAIVPQVQSVYQHLAIDSFTDTGGFTYEFDDSDSLEGRAGVNLEFTGTLDTGHAMKASLGANVVHDFMDGGEAIINGTALGYGGADGTSLLLAGGFSATPLGDGLRFGVHGNYLTSLDDDGRESISVSATLGYSW